MSLLIGGQTGIGITKQTGSRGCVEKRLNLRIFSIQNSGASRGIDLRNCLNRKLKRFPTQPRVPVSLLLFTQFRELELGGDINGQSEEMGQPQLKYLIIPHYFIFNFNSFSKRNEKKYPF